MCCVCGVLSFAVLVVRLCLMRLVCSAWFVFCLVCVVGVWCVCLCCLFCLFFSLKMVFRAGLFVCLCSLDVFAFVFGGAFSFSSL